MKIIDDYGDFSEEDAKKIKEFRDKEYPHMETNVEIVGLPSGKNIWVYCDGRVFLEDDENEIKDNIN